MKLFTLRLIPSNSASKPKFPQKGILHAVLGSATLFSLVVMAVLFLLDYFSPSAQTTHRNDSAEKIRGLPFFAKSIHDSDPPEVLNLAKMIRLITDDRLSPIQGLLYAELISQASQKFGVNPLEIIALILVESDFQEKSINTKTGDYGLGQINWKHWGEHNELTPQDLLDPSINIPLICQVYKFFGEDFGRYHRGNGPQCEAYLLNVNTILSALNAFADLSGSSPFSILFRDHSVFHLNEQSESFQGGHPVGFDFSQLFP